METGKALEIVHAMANRLWLHHSEFCSPAKYPADVQTALDTIEDLIVNNFEEDEEDEENEIQRRDEKNGLYGNHLDISN